VLLRDRIEHTADSTGNRSGRDEASREYLLDIYAKLGPLWKHVPDGGITWIGTAGEMEFTPDDEDSLKSDLISAGYTDSYWAATGTDRWGLREPGVRSTGLHWRGERGGKVNVHIDLHPPSGTGFWHWWEDKERRASTHTKESIRQSLEEAKVDVPVLSQQNFHGRLTGRLEQLRTSVGTEATAKAFLDRAANDLTQAGAILWNRELVTRDQLKDAAVLLAQADHELDAATQSRSVR